MALLPLRFVTLIVSNNRQPVRPNQLEHVRSPLSAYQTADTLAVVRCTCRRALMPFCCGTTNKCWQRKRHRETRLIYLARLSPAVSFARPVVSTKQRRHNQYLLLIVSLHRKVVRKEEKKDKYSVRMKTFREELEARG